MAAKIPVLVVGAGPVGLTMACELRRHGTACRVIDRHDGPTPLTESRALAVWERTLEVFEGVGVIDRVLAKAKRVRALNAYADGKRILHVDLDLDDPDTPYPFVLALGQGETERALLERLSGLGAEVEWRGRLTDVRPYDGGVRAAVVGADGNEQTIDCAWLVACDGAGSTVRQRLGVPFTGTEYEEPFLLADVGLAWNAPDDEITMLLLREGGGVAGFPLPEPGRWRLVDATGAAVPDDPAGIVARFVSVLHANGHPEATIGDVTWTSSFHIHRRIAEHFRVGRCFLAGDAAHVHSPAGGQGMNTGIQDAYNLGWKLALVVAGTAGEALPDSYEAERRPVALAVLRGTDLLTRVMTLRHPVAEAVRNTLMSLLAEFDFVRRRIARSLSELDVNYRVSPIVAEDQASLVRTGPRPGDLAPDVALATGRLFEMVRDTRHVLLLFEGLGRSPDAAALASVTGVVRGRYADQVAVWLVSPSDGASGGVHGDGPRLVDAEGRLHERFGAGSACLYLIRPDGRVGYRSQPPDADRLAAYLRQIFHS